jgi:hypothetical protein
LRLAWVRYYDVHCMLRLTNFSDMATTAAQMASYFYPEGEAPEDAFSWWLSPCGGSELVPDEIKKAFGKSCVPVVKYKL